MCGRVIRLQKRGGEEGGSGEMRERIQCDGGCHSNAVTRKWNVLRANLLIFRPFISPLPQNYRLFILENYFPSYLMWFGVSAIIAGTR